MKSTAIQLKSRGFIEDNSESNFTGTFTNIVTMLNSKIPSDRTLAARLLKNHKSQDVVSLLIDALKKEKKLYSKIELCNTLVFMDKPAINPLINSLGIIGNNQHKKVPEKEFLKDSYPLPRDIASRVLIRIGKKAMPALLSNLKNPNTLRLSELVDTIGHINFYSPNNKVYDALKYCFKIHQENPLILFKLIRACSGILESKSFLENLKSTLHTKRLLLEIDRSLFIITKKKRE